MLDLLAELGVKLSSFFKLHGSNGKIDLGHGNDNAYVRSNWLSYNSSNTGLYGGDGDDVINSTWNHSLINGGSGDDSLHVNDNRG